VAEFPNECWQADVTHVEVADGIVYEVLNIIDDHSRLCVASHVFVVNPLARHRAHVAQSG
jgi:transposase InsO family protein